MSAATVVVGEKPAAADRCVGLPSVPAALARDARDATLEFRDSDSVCDSDRKRRIDAERLGGGKKLAWWTGGEMGGEFGPRREYRRWMAESHSVSGCVDDSPMWPQPESWVKFA
jgi:hypothetical protein